MFLSLQQSDINLDIGLGNIPIDQITKIIAEFELIKNWSLIFVIRLRPKSPAMLSDIWVHR